MSQKSRLVQLNDYVVVEYQYSTDNLRTFDLGAIVQNNSYFGYKQFSNADYATAVTGNVLDRSASRLALNQWVLTDIDVPTQYVDVDTKLGKVDITTSVDSLTQIYDTVRFHILSGYNLEGIQGFIAEINAVDNSGNICLLASQCYLISDSSLEFNPRPLFLGDRMYDRYLDVKIPSLRDMNRTYNAQPSNSTTLGYLLSTNNNGFSNDSLIGLSFTEVATLTTSKTFTYLAPGQNWKASFPQEDTYFLFSCQVQESTAGDYFEYYPTYDDDFISDYIGELNSIGGNWIAINSLVVSEQIGTTEVITANFSSQQTTGFDQALLYRPIIVNSDSFSFSIDYTCQLLNRVDGSQIIRTSSVTSYSPKKYGMNLQKLSLLNPSEPIKVYNKVVTSTPISINPVQQIYKTSAVYYPSFFETFDVAISTGSVFLDSSGNLAQENNLDSDIVWGQGECVIYLNPFVNFVKFKILEKISDGVYNPLDLNYNSSIYLTFISNSSSNTAFANITDATLSNLATGEILFKIDQDSASSILSFTNTAFYLNVVSPSGDTVNLYQGSFDNFSNIGNYQASIDAKRDAALNVKIALLQSLQASSIASNTVVVTANTTVAPTSTADVIVSSAASTAAITIDSTNATGTLADTVSSDSSSSLLDIVPASLTAAATANGAANSVQEANIAAAILASTTPAYTTVVTTSPVNIRDVASSDVVASSLTTTTTILSTNSATS